MCGVIRTTSSLRTFLSLVLLNSPPMSGRSPIIGTCVSLLVRSSLNRPPIIIVLPSFTIILVLTVVRVFNGSEPLLASCSVPVLNSGLSSIRTYPFSHIKGLKRRIVPLIRNSTEVVVV